MREESEQKKEVALCDAIVELQSFRSQLEEVAKDIIGKVDQDTIAYYNNLVGGFDIFIDLLKKADKHTPDGCVEECLPTINEPLETFFRTDALIEKRAYKSLRRGGLHTTADLTYATERDIKNLRCMGEKSFELVRTICEENNIPMGENVKRTPKFAVGEKVITRTACGYIEKGTRCIIAERNDGTRTRYSFCMTTYKCVPEDPDKNMGYVVCSPGELGKTVQYRL